MSTEESTGKPPEEYAGDQIDSIQITGGTKVFEEVKILLNDGNHITMRAKMDISEHRIVPWIIAERGHWFRGPSNKSMHSTSKNAGE